MIFQHTQPLKVLTMKKLILICLLLIHTPFTLSKEFIVVDYETEIPEDYIQLDHELNKYYQLVIQQLEPQYRNRFAQIQQKWIRYRSRHCTGSNDCKINVTEIQTKNLEILLVGKIHINSPPNFKIRFDLDGEITQLSYATIRELMLDRYNHELAKLDQNNQREYRKSYEIYNAYLYDYCELLSSITPESFLNCQVKGLIDFQYSVQML